MGDPDVVVVGAGAAGVGAGLELTACGVSCLILEADRRVGGRAFTDKTSLDRTWDQGCHWLHCADANPLVAWADRLGAEYASDPWVDHFLIWKDGRWADSRALEEARASLLRAFDDVDAAAAAERGDDCSVFEALSDAGPWGWASRHILTIMLGEDPEWVSATGAADYEDTGLNWPVTTGYGDLIERMAAGLPIRTATPVTGIDQSADGVRVQTPDGTLNARAVIVTASTNVLLSGAIAFGAGPARDLLTLVEDVPCGAYEKVAIGLDRRPVDEGKLFFTIDPGNGAPPIEFQTMPADPPMVIAHVAGDVARQLVRAGSTAMVEVVIDRLASAFGSDVRRRIRGTAVTGWQDNPFVQGGYSHAKPKRAHRRHEMIAADTGRVVFAGEAFSPHWQATAHGAYQSGRDVASRIVRKLRLV